MTHCESMYVIVYMFTMTSRCLVLSGVSVSVYGDVWDVYIQRSPISVRDSCRHLAKD